MDLRAQVSMVFHLDKCIGCHTCSVACKNIWTDREGAEYMWWNNVETKPGTGYPTQWEDQEKYRGGFEARGEELKLKLQSRGGVLANIFFNPYLPTVDDYYEPFTYDYEELFNAPEGDDQPTARAVSMISGEEMEIEAGPNWDDDLGGSNVYAANDPNLDDLSEEERERLQQIEQIVFFYLPRICNHCANPGCAAACPAGAIYKRGEDGIVLIDQNTCRGWRMCVSGCPYKKPYFNWKTGKSEKCILCYPRLESGQPPACFHSCVGRIRYLGLVLYDADQTKDAASAPEDELVDVQRQMILDPHDDEVIARARAKGISDDKIEAAQNSPVYKFVKDWELALPLHPEFRTLPMLFYVPPLGPVQATISESGAYEVSAETNGAVHGADPEADPIVQLNNLDEARVPMRYLASLFSAGDVEMVKGVLKKLMAVRIYRRRHNVQDYSEQTVERVLREAGITVEEAEAIFHLTSRPTYDERFVVPPLKREEDVETMEKPYRHRSETGFGSRQAPDRRW